MKKFKLLALMFLLVGNTMVFGQEKIYYPDQELNTDTYLVKFSNIVGLESEIKFKIDIENKTENFLLFDATKCEFNFNGTTVKADSKLIIIPPYKSKSKTLGGSGSALNQIKEFGFKLDGIQEVELTDEKFVADQFILPPSKNDFKTGAFFIALKSLKKESGYTGVKYEVQYKGDKIGFVYPSKISVTMPDGNDYANGDKNSDPIMLFRGDKDKFTPSWDKMPGGRMNDMQLVEMKINFDGVFREGVKVDIPSKSFKYTWDRALTIAKNQ